MKRWAVANATRPAAVTDLMIQGCLSCQSMCSPCSPEIAPAPSSVALVTMGTCLALVMWSEKQVCFFVLLLCQWLCPRLPTGTPRQDRRMTCIFCYSFSHSLALIFTTLVPVCLHPSLHLAKQPALFTLFSNVPSFVVTVHKLGIYDTVTYVIAALYRTGLSRLCSQKCSQCSPPTICEVWSLLP